MQKKTPPRVVPSFDDYYMGMTYWIASKSKDPSTQCGAILIDNFGMPRGWGYNGPPKCVNDKDVNWKRPEKYPFIVHAEQNALDHYVGEPSALRGGTIYITGFPCIECTRRILTKGLKKIIYGPQPIIMISDEVKENVKELCKLGSVTLESYKGNLNWMRDRIAWMERAIPEIFDAGVQ